MNNHTPGNWIIDCRSNESPMIIRRPPLSDNRRFDEWMAIAQLFGPEPMRTANARLIAAAPDLLEALKGIRDIAEVVAPGSAFMPDIAKICKTAIAKARGV